MDPRLFTLVTQPHLVFAISFWHRYSPIDGAGWDSCFGRSEDLTSRSAEAILASSVYTVQIAFAVLQLELHIPHVCPGTEYGGKSRCWGRARG